MNELTGEELEFVKRAVIQESVFRKRAIFPSNSQEYELAIKAKITTRRAKSVSVFRSPYSIVVQISGVDKLKILSDEGYRINYDELIGVI